VRDVVLPAAGGEATLADLRAAFRSQGGTEVLATPPRPARARTTTILVYPEGVKRPVRPFRPVPPLGAGIVLALSAALLAPPAASADPAAAPDQSAASPEVPADLVPAAAAEVLGQADAQELALRLDPERFEAAPPAPPRPGGQDEVVLLLTAARAGAASTQGLERAVRSAAGTVLRSDAELGYVRALVPLDRAVPLLSGGSVERADVDRVLPLPQLSADSATGTGAATAEAEPAPRGPRQPSTRTTADNPFLPIRDIGADRFLAQRPGSDGRGVTVAVVDTGIDLTHPAFADGAGGTRVADWVPLVPPGWEDPSWLQLTTAVEGPAADMFGAPHVLPPGRHLVGRFEEGLFSQEYGSDIDRDGTTDEGFTVLVDPATGQARIDTDGDGDLVEEAVLGAYAADGRYAVLGTDDPATPVRESVPVVLTPRIGVPDPWNPGAVQDWVHVGFPSHRHATHVAGIVAGTGMWGSQASGVAPGTRLISGQACVAFGCPVSALLEGVVDLAQRPDVDIINLSLGGLMANNDGSSARALAYDRLVAEEGVVIVVSAGNDGPGLNTVSDPGDAAGVITAGASITRATWRANYGADVPGGIFAFSARGPREDGLLKPEVVAPGSALSAVPQHWPGDQVAGGYEPPAGYQMANGTSMSAPMTAGAAALLLSAMRQRGAEPTPAQVKAALMSAAVRIGNADPSAQGAGRVDVPGAWDVLRRLRDQQPWTYRVEAPVCSEADGPGGAARSGGGVYLRCTPADGGLAVGERQQVVVRVTRTSGPAQPVAHDVRWLAKAPGVRSAATSVRLPLNTPVEVPVTITAADGLQSALLAVDAPRTPVTDALVPITVVAGRPLVEGAWRATGSVERGRTVVHTVDMPRDAGIVKVTLGGTAADSQVRFRLFHPAGYPLDFGFGSCFINYVPPTGPDPRCEGPERYLTAPSAGQWQVVVESRRTTPLQRNPYTIDVVQLRVDVPPATAADPGPGGEAPFAWQVRNLGPELRAFAGVQALGAAREQAVTLADGQTWQADVELPRLNSDDWPSGGIHVFTTDVSNPGARFAVALTAADGTELPATGQEFPAPWTGFDWLAPGTYRLSVTADLPAGSAPVDLVVRDVLRSGADFGRVEVDPAWREPRTVAAGAQLALPATALPGPVAAPPGRRLFAVGFLRLDETSMYAFPEVTLVPRS
jgi:subtilisin family serine protease